MKDTILEIKSKGVQETQIYIKWFFGHINELK